MPQKSESSNIKNERNTGHGDGEPARCSVPIVILPRYERLPSGDVLAMRAYGSTRYELFEHAGEAMFSVGRDLGAIPPRYSRPLVAPGDTHEELLANWLDELLYLGRAEGLEWSSCIVDRLEEGGVQGSAAGLPAAEVVRTGPIVTGVRRLATDLVPIPGGWWVDIEFDTGGDVGRAAP
jgi:SHS2 domain-containing protein